MPVHRLLRCRRTVSALVIALASGASWAFAGEPTITVSDKVIRYAADMQPLGLNGFGDVGGTPHAAGNLILDPGFEPTTMRELYRVIDAGEDKGKHWIALDGPGTSYYLLYTTGTFSGAAMRAYRFVDGQGKPLPAPEVPGAQGGKMIDTHKAQSLVKLFESHVIARGAPNFPDGGWIAPSADTFAEDAKLNKQQRADLAKQWRVYYDSDQPLLVDDVVMFQQTLTWPDEMLFHPRFRGKGVRSTWDVIVGTRQYVPLPDDAPPEMDGGHSAMQMSPADNVAQVWQKLFGATGRPDAKWYSSLEEGVTYRFEAWVKSPAGGRITLALGDAGPTSIEKGYFGQKIEQGFDVSGQWTKVGFQFVAPHTPAEGGIEGAILRYEGAGPAFIDNVKLQPVYAPGDADKPFVIERKLFEEMLRTQPPTGHKGAVRIWSGLSPEPMEALCSWAPANRVTLGAGIALDPNSDITLPKALTILEATGDSAETRMVPWIITQITDSEDEYRQLIEYLAAPYDPAKDSPQTKPFAYRRTLQRGNNRPWTDDFRQVILEFGNENWHNRHAHDWIGLGRYSAIHQFGPDYGLWAKYMVGEIGKSPYFDAGKIKFCLGGNYSAHVNPDGTVVGFGQEASQFSGGINAYEGHATYVGPRWETGDHSQTAIDDSGVVKTLFGYRGGLDKEWAGQAAANQALRNKGLHVALAAYEGGPSGFGLRAKTPAEDLAGEYYGKSTAMATAMLDAWVDAWRLGWGYQCYLAFAQGHWWSSHTSFAQGFHASPSFEIETLINHDLANMDMLDVTVADSPTVAFEQPRTDADIKRNAPAKSDTLPVIFAHAMSDASRLSVAVVNLDLNQPHRVTLKLPIATAKKIKVDSLTGEPRDTNLESLKAKIGTADVDASQLKDGTFSAELPAGMGAIYVFDK